LEAPEIRLRSILSPEAERNKRKEKKREKSKTESLERLLKNSERYWLRSQRIRKPPIEEGRGLYRTAVNQGFFNPIKMKSRQEKRWGLFS